MMDVEDLAVPYLEGFYDNHSGASHHNPYKGKDDPESEALYEDGWDGVITWLDDDAVLAHAKRVLGVK